MKAIIWGHKPEDGHTHSYVHAAFFKAFAHLGYETLWLDNSDIVDDSSLKDSIFLTEGQVDAQIPVIKGCKYVLHNCDLKKYQDVLPNCLNLQVYTHDALKPERNVQKIKGDFIFLQPKAVVDSVQVGIDNRTLYMPWATNLLPHEFPKIDVSQMRTQRTNVCNWVGSVCGGFQGNETELQEFARACQAMNVQVQLARFPDGLPSIRAIQWSHTAPALQGQWQVDKGYIPCRVFKNISYGRIPGTNNPTVQTLFQGNLPYGRPGDLVKLAWDRESSVSQEDLDDLMNFVRDHHTYVNRIQQILEVL